jgi:hypothetical protein
MIQVSDAGKREEEISVSEQGGTVSAPRTYFDDKDYDWFAGDPLEGNRPGEWCEGEITDTAVIEDIWNCRNEEIPVQIMGDADYKRRIERRQQASFAWNNVPYDVRKEYEAKHNAERAIRAREQREVSDEGKQAERRVIRKEHKNLKDRAAALDLKDSYAFADLRPFGLTLAEAKQRIQAGGTVPMGPENTEVNLYRFFDALFVGGKIDELHYDTSRRMLVDENGVVVDDAWAARDLMDAARKVKFKGLSSDTVIKALRVWALDFKFNDITERVKAKLANIQWDEDERLERFLIDTFQCADTSENRLFSKYWCLSLYNRVMNPGCRAPIAMALFGGMDAGKSYFQKLICEELLFNADAAPVEFDPARKTLDLFRDIYGNSIIASIPEMTGFGKSDLRKMKAFMTGTTDTFDQKYGFSSAWPRQFIVVMDGNSYSGLWRDDDDADANGESQGERRFFPIFAYEIPASTSAIRWRVDKDLKLPYLNDGGAQFREDLWQVMKECETFMKLFGDYAYDKLVSETSRMVRDFSKREKDAGQGTVRDKTFDEHFPSVLYRCIKTRGMIGTVKVGDEKIKGLRVLTKDLQTAYFDLTRKEISPQQISKKMKTTAAKKGEAGRDKLKVTAFVFDDKEFTDLPVLSDKDTDYSQKMATQRVTIAKEFVRLYVSEESVSDNEGDSSREVEDERF